MAEIEHQAEAHRFVATLDGRESYLSYAPRGEDRVDFRSTWVDPSLRGRGVGVRLVTTALDWARGEGRRVIPTCWFVGTVVRRFPEYEDVLVE